MHSISKHTLANQEKVLEVWSHYYPQDKLTINSSSDKIVFNEKGLAVFKIPKFKDDMKRFRKWNLQMDSTTDFFKYFLDILSNLEPGEYRILPYTYMHTKKLPVRVYNFVLDNNTQLKLSWGQSGYINNTKFFFNTHLGDAKLSSKDLLDFARTTTYKLAYFIQNWRDTHYDLEKDTILVIEKI